QVRVIEQHGEVEGPEQFDHPAADPGRADDAHGPPVVADIGPALRGAAGVSRVATGQLRHSLAGQQYRGERVLGDRAGVSGGGGRDDDATRPYVRADVVFDRAGG